MTRKSVRIALFGAIGLLLMIPFQNCGAPQPVAKTGEAASSSQAPSGSLVLNGKVLQSSIVLPEISAEVDGPVGGCAISFSNRGHSLNLSGVTRNACAQACATNAADFPLFGLSCSFGGSAMASRQTRQRGWCQVSSDADVIFSGVASQGDCNSTCQFAIDTTARPSSVVCAFEDRPLFYGPLQTDGRTLGSCSIEVTGPVAGNLSIVFVDENNCNRYCSELQSKLASVKSDATCGFTSTIAPFNI